MFAVTAAPRASSRTLWRWCAATLAAALAFVVVLRLAVGASLPNLAAGALATATFIALVACVFQTGVALGPLATDEEGRARPLHRRHGFWVVTLGTAIALPTLGAFGLVDPWETHYAEVAREMLARRDFVSPWWANEGWFMSKPVLTFWLEAIAMATLGVNPGPNMVLAGGGDALARPEWAVRLPGFLLAIVGAYVLYNGVSRTCGRRPAFIGAVALLSMPGYALLSHQAMTDMPLVAGVAASLGLLLRAASASDSIVVRAYVVHIVGRDVELHAGHAAAAALLAVTLPQLVAIASLHLHVDASGLHLGADRLLAGSPHACGLPSQPACARVVAAHPRLPPALAIVLFGPFTLWIASRLGTERRAARLFALGAWGAASFAAMAKGPAGLVVPATAALVHALATRSLRTLGRLELPLGFAVAAAMIGPWYLAVYARHGRAFLDELVMRHMLGRALDHLHDTNEGEDVGVTYFVRQLGYATFPWSGVALAAIVSATQERGRSARDAARAVLFGGALVAFAIVSAMRTKFHHYGLVTLPPVAMLAGLWIDERLVRHGARRQAYAVTAIAASVAVSALVAVDVAGAPSRFIHLVTYRYSRTWPSTSSFTTLFVSFGFVVTAAGVAFAWRRARVAAAAAIATVAVAFRGVLIDAYLPGCASDGGQRGVLGAFYIDRARDGGGSGPLVAYQLNWKGENFYTGNELAIFVSSGAPMRTYLEQRRRSGDRRVYFVTERGRVAALRAELGSVRRFAELTDAHVSHEFTLVRADL